MERDPRPMEASEGTNNARGADSVKLLNDVMTTLMSRATKPAPDEVTNIGQVDRMELPQGWQSGPDYSRRQHTATYREFHPADAPDAQLGFYYRGRRTSDAAGQNFRDVLDKPSHILSSAEFRSLAEIVRDKSRPEDFQLKSAHTESINGKRVLIVEGRYTGNQNDSKHIFIDADGTGTAVQEVFFQAPKDKYQRHAQAADEALHSIRWK